MKKLQSTFRVVLLVLIAFAIQLSSCKKDENDLPSNPAPPSGSTLKTTVIGKITDTGNMVVSGVTVKLGSQTTVTDLRGHFLFVNADVPKDRMILKASKQGYFECIKGKRTQTGGVNYVDLVMQELPAAVNVSAVAGGVVNIPGGARITFPANAFVDAGGNVYTGTVKVYARHFNPAAAGFAAIVPGGDLIGKNTLGENVALYPMGMIEALLKDNSGVNEIKLATGVTAQLRMPIDPSQNAMAQNTVPLWYLDEGNGIWKEEGEAVKNGNFFEGNVSHFSTWNCDYPGERTDIKGKVVDCQGVPVAGAVVTINGFMNVITNNNGEYSTWVPAGFVITCQVLTLFNPIFTSNSLPQTITALGGQLNIVPDFIVPCISRLSGSVYICGGSQLSPAHIYASWNTGYNTIYSTDGNFSILVPENQVINVQAFTYNFSDITSITSGNTGSNTNCPPLNLCSIITPSNNSFIVDYNGDSIVTYTINTDSTFALINDYDYDGIIETYEISIAGIAQPGSWLVYIDMILTLSPDGINFNFNVFDNDILIQMYDDNNSFYQGLTTSGGIGNTLNRARIDDFGQPGGFMTGQFEFDNVGAGIKVKSGQFSALRTN